MGISDSGQLCLNSFSADCDKHYGRYEDPLRTHSVAYCICFCMFGMGYKKKNKEKERCVIGNNTIYQTKSICQCEKGGEGEEK